MPEITTAILNQHEWFRVQFAALDELQATGADAEALTAVWQPLATTLDIHALAEEEFFYPALLKMGEDPEDETLDAIGDHNDIRDGVAAAEQHPIGTGAWWAGVGQARAANDEHMGEEEREGLSDFRRHASMELRETIGQKFGEFFSRHPTLAGLDNSDKDPEQYVQTIEAQLSAGTSAVELSPSPSTAGSSTPRSAAAEGSLGIGSLKGH